MGDPRTRTGGATIADRATSTAAAALAACLMLGVGHAAAQQAMVVISHNDPDGLMSPGETVQITTTVSWQGATFLEEIRGDVRGGVDIGVASGNVFPHSTYASVPLTTIVDPGQAMGGSVTGLHLHAAAAV